MAIKKIGIGALTPVSTDSKFHFILKNSLASGNARLFFLRFGPVNPKSQSLTKKRKIFPSLYI